MKHVREVTVKPAEQGKVRAPDPLEELLYFLAKGKLPPIIH